MTLLMLVGCPGSKGAALKLLTYEMFTNTKFEMLKLLANFSHAYEHVATSACVKCLALSLSLCLL